MTINDDEGQQKATKGNEIRCNKAKIDINTGGENWGIYSFSFVTGESIYERK